MYRDRFRIGRLLALGALLVTAGCGEPDDGRPTAAAPGWTTPACSLQPLAERPSMPAAPARRDAVLAEIERTGRREFPTSFAGVEVDRSHAHAVVHRVPSPAFDDVIRRLAATDVCVQVRDAAHSAADLAGWHDRVLADLPYWTSRGIRIVTIGARHDGTGVQIGTRDVTRARTELPARYGSSAPLIFVAEPPPRPLTATSPADPPPRPQQRS